MKRRIAIMLLLLLSAVAATVAQDVKRVAILETVDRAGDVPLGVKNLLRQSITFGINHIDGYEGYNRVNMDQINKEHEFQRTGYVSDADIKKLGKMTGAAYVLIAEASIYDAKNIVVFANLIDVETGRVANSSIPKVAGINPKSMYEDCAEVAKSLLGVAQTTTKVAEQPKSATPTGFVNLGLSTDTKWKKFNSGMYSYDEAVSKFGSSLPSQEQWEELKSECQWTWTGNEYKVTGPNGNSIYLPASGYRSCDGNTYNVGHYGHYWSSTPNNSNTAWLLLFNSKRVNVDSKLRCNGNAVRLVTK